MANAGAEPSVVLNKVAEGTRNFGYNAANDTYGDLVEMGVLDPTKVTRCALQSAASVAALILTTDAMVAELPKEESHRHRVGLEVGRGTRSRCHPSGKYACRAYPLLPRFMIITRRIR